MRWPRFSTIVAIWVPLAGLRLWAGWDFIVTGRTADPDAVMRLVQVRDWLGGQGWYDLTQYRIGPPGGVAMHWTRLADLLPGSITWLLTQAVGAPVAERIAMILTPLVLLFAATWLIVGIVRMLAGRDALLASAVVLASALGMMTLFTPGDIDHHNLQLVLVLVLLRATLGGHPTGMAAAVVLSLIVGIETAPIVVAILGTVGLRWLVDPHPHARLLRDLGRALIMASLAGLILFMPRPWPAQCDAWTLPVFWATLATGGVFVAASAASARTLSIRLTAPMVIAIAAVAAIAISFPACRVHPAGTDPLLWHYWMDHISENASLGELMREQGWPIALVLLGSVPAVIAAVIWLLANRRIDAARWLPMLAALFAALLITIVHARGQAILAGVSAAMAAGLIGRAAPDDPKRAFAWLAFVPLGWLFAGATLASPPPTTGGTSDAVQAACRDPAVMRALAGLPATTVVVPMMVEPHMLAATGQRSLAATYHRNQQGNHAMLAAMIAPPAAARAWLTENGVGAVLYCPGYGIDRYARENRGSLAAALVADRAPSWLTTPTRLAGGVRLYRINDGGR